MTVLKDRKCGVKLSRSSVGRLLAQLGIKPQKPLWRAYQQDPERVRKWLEEEYPAAKREPRRVKAVIWSGDQSGLRSDYHAGTTWGLKGKTPGVESTSVRFKLNMMNAVNRLGNMHFMIETGCLNAGGDLSVSGSADGEQTPSGVFYYWTGIRCINRERWPTR